MIATSWISVLLGFGISKNAPVLTLAAFAAQPSIEEHTEKFTLAFESHREGNAEVFLTTTDGRLERNLSNHPAGDSHPSWSPDGSRVAFYSNRFGEGEILVCQVNSGALARITDNDVHESTFVWSDDGEALVYSAGPLDNPAGSAIYLSRCDKPSATRRLTEAAGRYLVWDVVSGSSRVLFTRSVGVRVDIASIDLETGAVEELVSDGSANLRPQVSPDGMLVAFVSDRSGMKNLYVMPAAGGESRSLTESEDLTWGRPYWSKSGRIIGFTSDAAGSRDACTVNVETRAVKRVFESAHRDEFWGFLVDGRCLVVSDQAGSDDIYVVDQSGHNVKRVTQNRSIDQNPDYSKTGAPMPATK